MELIIENHISVFGSVESIEKQSLLIAGLEELVIWSSGMHRVVVMGIVAIWLLHDFLKTVGGLGSWSMSTKSSSRHLSLSNKRSQAFIQHFII